MQEFACLQECLPSRVGNVCIDSEHSYLFLCLYTNLNTNSLCMFGLVYSRIECCRLCICCGLCIAADCVLVM